MSRQGASAYVLSRSGMRRLLDNFWPGVWHMQLSKISSSEEEPSNMRAEQASSFQGCLIFGAWAARPRMARPALSDVLLYSPPIRAFFSARPLFTYATDKSDIHSSIWRPKQSKHNLQAPVPQVETMPIRIGGVSGHGAEKGHAVATSLFCGMNKPNNPNVFRLAFLCNNSAWHSSSPLLSRGADPRFVARAHMSLPLSTLSTRTNTVTRHTNTTRYTNVPHPGTKCTYTQYSIYGTVPGTIQYSTVETHTDLSFRLAHVSLASSTPTCKSQTKGKGSGSRTVKGMGGGTRGVRRKDADASLSL